MSIGLHSHHRYDGEADGVCDENQGLRRCFCLKKKKGAFHITLNAKESNRVQRCMQRKVVSGGQHMGEECEPPQDTPHYLQESGKDHAGESMRGGLSVLLDGPGKSSRSRARGYHLCNIQIQDCRANLEGTRPERCLRDPLDSSLTYLGRPSTPLGVSMNGRGNL